MQDAMTRIALVATLLALPATSLASTGAATAPSEQAGRRAALEIVEVEPVTVEGRGFKSRELVRISADGRQKRVTAGAAGRFVVLFSRARACNGLVVVARGSKGSRAAVTFQSLSGIHCLEP